MVITMIRTRERQVKLMTYTSRVFCLTRDIKRCSIAKGALGINSMAIAINILQHSHILINRSRFTFLFFLHYFTHNNRDIHARNISWVYIYIYIYIYLYEFAICISCISIYTFLFFVLFIYIFIFVYIICVSSVSAYVHTSIN